MNVTDVCAAMFGTPEWCTPEPTTASVWHEYETTHLRQLTGTYDEIKAAETYARSQLPQMVAEQKKLWEDQRYAALMTAKSQLVEYFGAQRHVTESMIDAVIELTNHIDHIHSNNDGNSWFIEDWMARSHCATVIFQQIKQVTDSLQIDPRARTVNILNDIITHCTFPQKIDRKKVKSHPDVLQVTPKTVNISSASTGALLFTQVMDDAVVTQLHLPLLGNIRIEYKGSTDGAVKSDHLARMLLDAFPEVVAHLESYYDGR